MDVKRKIATVVRENWPQFTFQFADHLNAPDAATHEQIDSLLKKVAGGTPTKLDEKRFRRLLGDPTREFGDVWLEDYRCQLSLTDRSPTRDSGADVSIYEVVAHSWEGVLEFCMSARRIPLRV